MSNRTKVWALAGFVAAVGVAAMLIPRKTNAPSVAIATEPVPAAPVDPGRAQYRAIVQALTPLADEQMKRDDVAEQAMLAELKTSLPAEWERRSKSLDLSNCRTSGFDFLGDWDLDDLRTTLMTVLAYDVLWWRYRLAPFPPSAWAADITAFEQAELDHILATSFDPHADLTGEDRRSAIIGDLNGYREAGPDDRREALLQTLAQQVNAARPPDALPRVTVEGGCGAGNVSVKIATDPAGGQVLFIPTFFYELCRAQATDPEDPAKCRRWREAIAGSVTSVAGDYQYVVHWADGSTRRGRLSVTEDQDGRTITLGKIK